MATSRLMFSSSLISDDVSATFPATYNIRPLARDDYGKGFLDCLRVLSHVGDVTEDQFQSLFDWMSTRGEGVHYHVVIEHEHQIVGTGALIVERKFIHNLGTIGHIEEIAISKGYQGKGLGLKLLASLSSLARNIGCYKTTLGTSVHNMPFYEKCGYERGGQCMSQYFEDPKDGYYRG